MTNIPQRITVKALTKIFNKDGVEGVKQMMSYKPKSGATLQGLIDELSQSGNDVTVLQTYHDENFIMVEKEYVQTYDRETYGDKDEITTLIVVGLPDWNAAKVYNVIRKQDVKPVFCKREPGARGKGTNIYNLREVQDAIRQYNLDKADEYLAEQPASMVTPADMLGMFPDDWKINNTSYCGMFVKFWHIAEQGKFRAPGRKGKGSSLYRQVDIENAIQVTLAVIKLRAGMSPEDAVDLWDEIGDLFGIEP